MSWIESHQSLLTHRKTLRASTQLKVSRYLLIGHLHALWWWALDNAKDDGDLGAALPEEIAEACGWPSKKAEALVDALVSAGFLDLTSSGMALHNWYRYAGKLNEKKAKDRLRKAEVALDSTGNLMEVAEKSQAPTYLPLSTSPTNQPTVPTSTVGGAPSKRPAAASPYNLTDAEWQQIYAKFPGAPVHGFWSEWIEWIEERESERKPTKGNMPAFIGFVNKKVIPAAVAR